MHLRQIYLPHPKIFRWRREMAVVTVDYTGMQGHVYTLLLEGGHYYVGWSSSVEHRIAQHFSGTGSRWTPRPPAVQVLTCVAGDTRLEDVVTQLAEGAGRALVPNAP